MAYNIKHKIYPSKNAIVERLLARRVEMEPVYAALHRKLSAPPSALSTFLDVVLATAAFWNSDRIAVARNTRTRLKAVNGLIAERADELAALLSERDRLYETSSFSTETEYHPIDVIDAAAAASGNYGYQSHVKDRLTRIRERFDLKYWPSLSELVAVIGDDAKGAGILAADPATAAAIDAPRASPVDFFRALFENIKLSSTVHGGSIPQGFRPTDESLATLANCALDLPCNRLATGDYVKRFRQRERERTNSRSRRGAGSLGNVC
ncbi:hypothetical protein [Mycobacterium sp. KBS0706]|uniref:hypothetical protein n=1 Tax=Mycobacterium sp. KBS0706 TaxID=2578109 RepID=UPI001C8F639E|nr:hypothetical protein [Mycobacterium sp. KBS0706]